MKKKYNCEGGIRRSNENIRTLEREIRRMKKSDKEEHRNLYSSLNIITVIKMRRMSGGST
jgi:hypothetical protein